MKNQWLIILVAMLFSACSSTYLIKKDDASLKELNNELEGEDVTITLLKGEEIYLENAKIFEDSSNYVDLKLSSGFRIPFENTRIPYQDIKKITNKNISRGTWEWLGYGVLIGLPTGVLIGWQAAWPGPSADVYGIVIGGLSGLLSGLIIGPIIGSAIGHKETYILNEPVE